MDALRFPKHPTTNIDTILSDSPFQQPTNNGPSAIEPASGMESPPLLPFAQLGLRLLGLMLFVDGVGAIFGGAVQGIFQARAYSNAGYEVQLDPHSVAWVASGVPILIAGLYFIVDGNWVLRNVFTSSRNQNTSLRERTDAMDDSGWN
jgi:hypothetical protein